MSGGKSAEFRFEHVEFGVLAGHADIGALVEDHTRAHTCSVIPSLVECLPFLHLFMLLKIQTCHITLLLKPFHGFPSHLE